MGVLDSLIKFGFLFAAVAVFILLCVILSNLFLKSYKPQNTLILISMILIVFIVNVFLAYNSMGKLLYSLRNPTSNSSSTEKPSITPQY
jgi:hypothetical protein